MTADARPSPAPLTAGAGGTGAPQRMAPAPPLPSVLDESPVGNGRAERAASDALGRAHDFTRRVMSAHQEYLDRSAQLHRAFLELWQRTNAALAGTARQAGPVTSLRGAGLPESARRAELPEAAPGSALQPRPSSARPALDRDDLIVLASGRISSVFGERFARQDGHAHQVRPPKPPLLFLDRVTRIDAEPGSMGQGRLWTETDVSVTSWYLDDAGRMPPGVVAEAGDGHLVLLSWLGVDWQHDGRRRGRLMGAEVTVLGALPSAGDTCVYEVQLESHAKAGDAPLAVLHYTCSVGGEPRAGIRVQMGLFSPEELAAASGTVAWNAATNRRALEGSVRSRRALHGAAGVLVRGGARVRRGPARRLLRARLRTDERTRADAEDPGQPAAHDRRGRGLRASRRTLAARVSASGSDDRARRLVLRRPLPGRPLHARLPHARGRHPGDGLSHGDPWVDAGSGRLALRARARDLRAGLQGPDHARAPAPRVRAVRRVRERWPRTDARRRRPGQRRWARGLPRAACTVAPRARHPARVPGLGWALP